MRPTSLKTIVSEIRKGNPIYLVAFDKANNASNFSFQFKKTEQYWSINNWLEVARQTKKFLNVLNT